MSHAHNLRVIDSTRRICKDLNTAYGRNSDLYEYMTARAGHRVSFALIAYKRIERATGNRRYTCTGCNQSWVVRK